MRILVVEDHVKTAAFISKALRAEQLAVNVLGDGEEALQTLSTQHFDTVVLDIGLPGRDGVSILRQLRARGNPTPVLLLSARSNVNEKVEGLEAGAADYLAKPFALAELIARVRTLLRRNPETNCTSLRVADLTLDTTTRIAIRGGRRIELTTREYQILELLMRSAGHVCSRMAILEKVWDYDFDPGSNVVDVHVARLRGKIDSKDQPELLHSVRGVGYILNDPKESSCCSKT
jgi:two-component system, OmpR family, response regulator